MTVDVVESNKEILREVQVRIEEERDSITTFFNEAMTSLNAKAGFVGFENLEGKIGIFTSAGATRFVYADKSEGFAGHILSTGESGVYDSATHRVLATEGVANSSFSEIGGAINYKDRTVGVVLFDRHELPAYEESDCSFVDGFCAEIARAISGLEPWFFRRWWQQHEPLAQKAYVENLNRVVIPILKGFGQSQFEVATFGREGFVKRQTVSVSPGGSKVNSEIEEEVRLYGRTRSRPDFEVKGKVGIPFPSTGPVLGVLTVNLETGDDPMMLSLLSKRIAEAIERLPFSYFDKMFHKEDVSGLFVSLMMNCFSNAHDFFGKIDTVCRDIRTLVQAKFTVYLCDDIWSDSGISLEAEKWRVVDEVDLRRRVLTEKQLVLRKTEQSNRPMSWIRTTEGESQLNCPVWVGTRLLAGIQSAPIRNIRSGNSRYGYELDGPVIEVISTVLARIVAEEVRKTAMSDLLELCSSGRGTRVLDDCHSVYTMRLLNAFFLAIGIADKREQECSIASEGELAKSRQLLENALATFVQDDKFGNFTSVIDTTSKTDAVKEIMDCDELRASELLVSKYSRDGQTIVMLAGLKQQANYRVGFSKEDILNIELACHLVGSVFFQGLRSKD